METIKKEIIEHIRNAVFLGDASLEEINDYLMLSSDCFVADKDELKDTLEWTQIKDGYLSVWVEMAPDKYLKLKCSFKKFTDNKLNDDDLGQVAEFAKNARKFAAHLVKAAEKAEKKIQKQT